MNIGHVSVCFICRGRSDGFGVGSPKVTPKWFCMDCGPALAKRLFNMNRTKMDTYEARALDSASPKIGQFLEERIGKTDMATFTAKEWDDFLREVITCFGESMRQETKELEPPF